jgi:hypothetical protein
MPPAGFKPTTPASDRPQSLTLDRSATGIGTFNTQCGMFIKRSRKFLYIPNNFPNKELGIAVGTASSSCKRHTQKSFFRISRRIIFYLKLDLPVKMQFVSAVTRHSVIWCAVASCFHSHHEKVHQNFTRSHRMPQPKLFFSLRWNFGYGRVPYSKPRKSVSQISSKI